MPETLDFSGRGGHLVMKTAKNTLLRNGVQEVVGSNPATPTTKIKGFRHLPLLAFPQVQSNCSQLLKSELRLSSYLDNDDCIAESSVCHDDLIALKFYKYQFLFALTALQRYAADRGSENPVDQPFLLRY